MDPSPSGTSGVRSEINVTPLVDVCLVLLIIFMVVTPMLGDSSAELPETGAPSRLGEPRDQLTLVIEKDGSLLLEEKRVLAPELERRLGELHSRALARPLVVKADRRLRYALVRGVLRDAQGAGFTGAGLAVRQAPRSGDGRSDIRPAGT
jgi:biopolymer transport protein ExbD